MIKTVNEFLRQDVDEKVVFEDTVRILEEMFA